MMKCLFAVLVLLGFLTLVFSCSCVYNHPQNKFCDSEFVIHAVSIADPMLNTTGRWKTKIYKLIVIEVFKDKSGELEPFTIVNALTEASGSLCGAYLAKYKSYVLGGNFGKSNNLGISLCGFKKTYKDLQPCELALMRGFVTYKYQDTNVGRLASHEKKSGYDCSCKIKHALCMKITGAKTDCSSTRSGCIGVNRKDSCIRENDGLCRWNKCPKGKFEQLYIKSNK